MNEEKKLATKQEAEANEIFGMLISRYDESSDMVQVVKHLKEHLKLRIKGEIESISEYRSKLAEKQEMLSMLEF